MLEIRSGGQTGVDRAAFDAALNLGFSISGFVPKGRWAEDGEIPESYPGLTETSSTDPSERTRRNVEASDATLIIVRGKSDQGTDFTASVADVLGKPVLHIDLSLLKSEQDYQFAIVTLR